MRINVMLIGYLSLAVGAVGGTSLQAVATKETLKSKDSNSNVQNPFVSRQGRQESQTSGQFYVR